MKLATHLKFTIIILFFSFFFSTNSAAQVVPMPYKNLGAFATGNSIGKGLSMALESLGSLSQSTKEFEEALEQSRNAYWKVENHPGAYYYPTDYQGSAEVEIRYASLLYQKDMLYLLFDFYNFIAPNQGSSSVKGLGDAIQRLTGVFSGRSINSSEGVLDGGINQEAVDEYEIWSINVCRSWGRLATSITDTEALNKAIVENTDAYLAYLKVRNASEFYNKNPYSPLKSGDPKTYFLAMSQANNLYEDYDAAKEDLEIIQTKANPEALSTALNAFKSVPNSKMNSQHLSAFDWAIAQSSRELMGIYVLKRKFYVSWKKANAILENRKKRYGADKVEQAITTLWMNKADANAACPVNPLYLKAANKRFNNIFNENEDCIAHSLGVNTIWYDLLDLANQEMDKNQIGNRVKAYLKSASQLPDAAHTEKYYTKLIELVDEDLLLSAFYIENKYGKNLFLSDMSAGNLDEQKWARHYDSNIFLHLLEGMAIAKQKCTTIVFLAELNVTDGFSDFDVNALENIKNKYNDAECAKILELTKFDDTKVSRISPCGVKHSQSFIYRKVCSPYFNLSAESTAGFAPQETGANPENPYSHYQIYEFIKVMVMAPDWPGCPEVDPLKSCFKNTFEEAVVSSFKEEILKQNIDISSLPTIQASVIIEPDGSYTSEYINTQDAKLVEAFNNCLTKVPNRGPFTLSAEQDQPARVRVGGIYLVKNEFANNLGKEEYGRFNYFLNEKYEDHQVGSESWIQSGNVLISHWDMKGCEGTSQNDESICKMRELKRMVINFLEDELKKQNIDIDLLGGVDVGFFIEYDGSINPDFISIKDNPTAITAYINSLKRLPELAPPIKKKYFLPDKHAAIEVRARYPFYE